MKSVCAACQATNRISDEIKGLSGAKCGRCGHPLFSGEVTNGTGANFNKLLNDDLPVIVDFWAPWCGPCRSFAPVFESTAQHYAERVRFVKVNTEEEQQLAASFAIRSIPTIMLFKKGKRVDTLNGALPKADFQRWLEQALLKN